MYIDWICSVYMYIRIVGYTDSKYISIDNNIDINIRIANTNVKILTIDW